VCVCCIGLTLMSLHRDQQRELYQMDAALDLACGHTHIPVGHRMDFLSNSALINPLDLMTVLTSFETLAHNFTTIIGHYYN